MIFATDWMAIYAGHMSVRWSIMHGTGSLIATLARSGLRSATRAGLVCGLLALGVVITGEVRADDAECLRCHGDAAVAARSAPGMKGFLVDPAKMGASVHGSWSCVDCHEGVDAKVAPHREKKAPVNCLACHDAVGKSHAFHPRLSQAEAPAGEDTHCAACHGSHYMVSPKDAAFVFNRTGQVAACGSCHGVESKNFGASAHGRQLLASVAKAPDCLSCHRQGLGGREGDTPAARKLAESRLCETCHVADEQVAGRTVRGAKFVESFKHGVHGVLLAQGRDDAPGCVDCHGAHEMNRASVSGAKTAKLQVAATCGKCHAEIAEEFNSSVHAAGLRRGNLDSPTCVDCHGEHDILTTDDPASPVYARNVAQRVCATCHSSLKLTTKYGLSSHTFETFSDSYHGLAMRGGGVEVVNCASCHAAHAIKSHLDPTSTVYRDNLQKTCGECHPGANARFAQGTVHVSPTAAKKEAGGEPVLYWISTLYTWLILIVVGGMVVHNGLDFGKKLRYKLALQKGLEPEPHVAHRLYLRMTVHERCQHGVLVLSFTLLVVTGFMLRFPEAWWVEAIRGLSSHAFSWRGWLHRGAGVVMLVSGAWHVLYLTTTKPGRALLRDLLPRWNDLTDPWKVLRYNLGLSPTKPEFGRFCYIEKTEYWAMVWGTLLMGVTGALLWFDNTTIGLLTKLGFDVARTVHYYEAILATLAIVVWHFYFVIFNPEVYPMNLAWLTGRMSELEMQEEHPAELARIKREEAEKARNDGETPPPQ